MTNRKKLNDQLLAILILIIGGVSITIYVKSFWIN